VNTFVDAVSSCQTVIQLSSKVLFVLSIFQRETRIDFVRPTPWITFPFLFLSLEGDNWNVKNGYSLLHAVFAWVKSVVESDDPSQTN